MTHCFKKGQPCEAGTEQLQAQLSILDEPNLPNPFQVITDSDIEEANDANMVDPDDDIDIVIDIELWTTSLGFALAQIRLVSYSQTLFFHLLREQSTLLICFVDVVKVKVK